MESVRKGNKETVSMLIDRGADINYSDNEGNTSLMIAATLGHTKTIEILIQKGATINAKNINGINSFMIAALNGRNESVKLLLDNGADINAQGNNGDTALFLTVKKGFAELATYLLDNGAIISDKFSMIPIMETTTWWTDLHTAVIKNDFDKIKTCEYNQQKINPINLAILSGNQEAVRALIARGISYDINDCLHTAIKSKRNDLAIFFLENGANPLYKNQLGQTAFNIASLSMNDFIFNYLVELIIINM